MKVSRLLPFGLLACLLAAGVSRAGAAADLLVRDIPGVKSLRIQRYHSGQAPAGSRSVVINLPAGKTLVMQLYTYHRPKAQGATPEESVHHTAETPAATRAAGPVATRMSFGVGYRSGRLDWNIASDITGTGTPNVLSELTWDELDIVTFDAGLRRRFGRGFELRGDFTYGLTFGGENQDSDYDGNNRTQEFSRSNNSADEGSLFEASAALGYTLDLGRWSGGYPARLTPLLGYAVHQQSMMMTDGVQTIATPGKTLPVGPFGGLDSTYEAEWRGPWAGLEVALGGTPGPGVTGLGVTGLFEYHWPSYEGVADWNLREDFAHPVSFRHEADDGQGLVVALGLSFARNENLTWSLDLNYERWIAEPGIITFFGSNGGVGNKRLNEANWESWGVGLSMSHRF